MIFYYFFFRQSTIDSKSVRRGRSIYNVCGESEPFGDTTFAPAIIAPAMISPTTKSKSEGDDWIFSSGEGKD